MRYLIAIAIFNIACINQAVWAEPYQAKVIHVWDGDSIVISTESGSHQIRVFGIDAPEKGQPFGREAKHYLEQLLTNQSVTIEPLEQDRYQRTIANVTLQQKSVAKLLVEQGYAWVFRRYNSDKSLINREKRARQQKRGLWQNSNPTPPWRWRRKE